MAKKNQSRILYCFLDIGGVVHTLDSSTPEKVVNTRLTPKEFIARLGKNKEHTLYDRYALNCHSSQIDLVFKLNAYRDRGFIWSVLVEAPWQGVARSVYKNPTVALELMLKNRRPASLGGYHEFNGGDMFALSALEQISKAKNKEQALSAIARIALPSHPVYRHAMFIDEINTFSLVTLIANIIDPRFVTVLGLGDCPHSAAVFVDMSTPGSMITHDLISSIWNNKPKDKHSKRAFLWRMYQKYRTDKSSDSGYDSLDDRDKNLIIRLNNAFLSYLFTGWTDKISISHRDRLFVPEIFFSGDYEDVAEEYSNYISIKSN